MLTGDFSFTASPAVVLEYKDVLKRPGILGSTPWLSESEVDQVLDAICLRAAPALPWFRVRPLLDDPKDDLYVECALAGGANLIVTSDKAFGHPALRAFGIRSVTARQFIVQEGTMR